MRLEAEQIERITHAVQSLAGDSTSVYLFGSRLDDARRGGDVDLLLECDAPLGLLIRARIKMELEAQLGMSVDIVEWVRGAPASAFKRVVRAEAVRLRAAA